MRYNILSNWTGIAFMSKNNQLFQALPYAVEEALKRLGQNLKMARTRRRLTIGQVAEKIGTGERAVSDAEKGKPTTAVSTYMALLWIYDLINDMKDVANPLKDEEGLRLALLKETKRGLTLKSELDNDF
jgi:transcriptional regulator with XRE-family HTH domain